jgi:hypothetical protein
MTKFGRSVLLAVALLLAAAQVSHATYTQQAALAVDSVFMGQIQVAMLQTAANVMTEAATTAGHLERASFAVAVIQNPDKWRPIIALLIASQANVPMTPLTVPSTVADSLVQTAVDAQWANMAGYFKR